MRVLITGAGGFIGGYLTATLAAADHDVVALVHRARPIALESGARLRVERVDLAGAGTLPSGQFDAALHCAAAIPAVIPDEVALVRINVESARRVFEHAARAGASKIIFCSSMAAYGRIDTDVVDPETPIRNPGAYGRSKLEGERLLAELCRANVGTGGLSIRLPGVVGAGSHDNFLSDTLARLLAGEPVVARNPEAPFNNVVHVADLATFMTDLLTSLPPGHRLTTIAAAEPQPIRRVVSVLETAAGRPGAVRYEQGGRTFLISNEAALRLGYRPPTVLASVTRFASEAVAWRRERA